MLARNPAGLNPNALYVVWAGSNDFFAALQNPDLSFSILTAGPYNVANAVCDLSDAGAKHFIVANLPDIGRTPLATPAISEVLTLLSAQFNQPF